MTHYYKPAEQAHDTHHLECPRCGHHSIVRHSEGRYACLNCHWRRNVSNRNVSNTEGTVPPLALIFITIVIILLMMG